jgi:hypothetical protein
LGFCYPQPFLKGTLQVFLTCYTNVDKKMNDQELQKEAEKAISRLKELRAEFKHGWISMSELKKEAKPLVEVFDQYAAKKARKFGLRHRKFSLSAFLR